MSDLLVISREKQLHHHHLKKKMTRTVVLEKSLTPRHAEKDDRPP
jgi:hypothetical protein